MASMSQESSTQSALIAHFTTGICQVGSAMFPMGEIAFFDALVNLAFYDTNNTATTILTIDYSSFLSFKIVKTIKSFRMRLPTDVVLPWVIHNKFPAESSQIEYFTISIALDDESFRVFLQQTAPFLAASHARARSASHMTVMPEPIAVDLAQIHARQEAMEAAAHGDGAAAVTATHDGGDENAEAEDETTEAVDGGGVEEEFPADEDDAANGPQYYQDEAGNIYVLDPNAPMADEEEEEAQEEEGEMACEEVVAVADSDHARHDDIDDGDDDAVGGETEEHHTLQKQPEEVMVASQLSTADEVAEEEEIKASAAATHVRKTVLADATEPVQEESSQQHAAIVRKSKSQNTSNKNARSKSKTQPPSSAVAATAVPSPSHRTALSQHQALIDEAANASPSCPALGRPSRTARTKSQSSASFHNRHSTDAVEDRLAASYKEEAKARDSNKKKTKKMEDDVAAHSQALTDISPQSTQREEDDAMDDAFGVGESGEAAAAVVASAKKHHKQPSTSASRGPPSSNANSVKKQPPAKSSSKKNATPPPVVAKKKKMDSDGPKKEAGVHREGSSDTSDGDDDNTTISAILKRSKVVMSKLQAASDSTTGFSSVSGCGVGGGYRQKSCSVMTAVTSAEEEGGNNAVSGRRSNQSPRGLRRRPNANNDTDDDADADAAASEAPPTPPNLKASTAAKNKATVNEDEVFDFEIDTMFGRDVIHKYNNIGKSREDDGNNASLSTSAKKGGRSAASSKKTKKEKENDQTLAFASALTAKLVGVGRGGGGGGKRASAAPSSSSPSSSALNRKPSGVDTATPFRPTTTTTTTTAAATLPAGDASSRGRGQMGLNGSAARTEAAAPSSSSVKGVRGGGGGSTNPHRVHLTESPSCSSDTTNLLSRNGKDTSRSGRSLRYDDYGEDNDDDAADGGAKKKVEEEDADATQDPLFEEKEEACKKRGGGVIAPSLSRQRSMLMMDDEDDDALDGSTKNRSSGGLSAQRTDSSVAALKNVRARSEVRLRDAIASVASLKEGRKSGVDAIPTASKAPSLSKANGRSPSEGNNRRQSLSTRRATTSQQQQRGGGGAAADDEDDDGCEDDDCYDGAATRKSKEDVGELSAMLAQGLEDDALDEFLKKAQQLVRKKKVEKRARAQSQAPVEVCRAAHDLVEAYCDKNTSQRHDFFASHNKRMSVLAEHAESLRVNKVRLVETVAEGLNTLSDSIDVVVACIAKVSERLEANKKVWDAADGEDQKAVLDALQQRIVQQQEIMQRLMA